VAASKTEYSLGGTETEKQRLLAQVRPYEAMALGLIEEIGVKPACSAKATSSGIGTRSRLTSRSRHDRDGEAPRPVLGHQSVGGPGPGLRAQRRVDGRSSRRAGVAAGQDKLPAGLSCHVVA